MRPAVQHWIVPRHPDATIMPRRSRTLIPALLLSAAALAVPCPSSAADAVRGRALYELRCDGCHTESVHGRTHRVARDMDDVRRWVARWNEHLRLQWGDTEIEDVAAYLNATYYRFPCETPACRALSMASGPRAR